jgi:hypothetical protein
MKFKPLRFKDVSVPTDEGEQTVRVRQLSGQTLLDYQAACKPTTSEDGTEGFENDLFVMATFCCFDPASGERLFTKEQADELRNAPSADLLPILKALDEVNAGVAEK